MTYIEDIDYNNIPENAFILENKITFRKKPIKRKLPLTKKANKEILESLKIPYSSYSDDMVEYWDSYMEEYDIISGPLYEHTSIGKYHYTGKSYSETFPSIRMIQVANFLTYKVEELVMKTETLKEIEEILDGFPSGFGTLTHNIEDGFFEFDEQEFYVFCIFLPSEARQKTYAIFNLDRITEGDTVELSIPKEFEKFKGWIIGKHGCNLKSWCNLLGLEKILIV